MKRLEKYIVDLEIKLTWNSSYASHEDVYFARINIWRDGFLLPPRVQDWLENAKEGDTIEIRYQPGDLLTFSENSIYQIDPRAQFKPPARYKDLKLRLGRFYPLGFFSGIPGIYEGNNSPGRIVGITEDLNRFILDANHPLAKYPLTLTFRFLSASLKEKELGGRCRDWLEELLNSGPGMQTRYNHLPTDFGFDDPKTFLRLDESEDTVFYSTPRLIGHIDRLCHAKLVEKYNQILPKKGKILDFMSSFESHLPQGDYDVTGLGINEEELKANPILSDFLVKDINKDPALPFPDCSFDVVVCDLSVEYITKPMQVLDELKRVLRKGGILAFSFSNRYFPPKVVNLWVELHEFERMGYVLELMIRAGLKDLHTYSLRGLPRPADDRWIHQTPLSDPLYLVWGKNHS